MKTASAILLLIVLGMPLGAPLLADVNVASVPACCRRDGKHHCMKTEASTDTGEQPAFTRIETKCPQCPRALSPTVHSQLGLSLSASVFAEIVSHPALSPQTETSYRISLARSHQKRGPPAIVLS